MTASILQTLRQIGRTRVRVNNMRCVVGFFAICALCLQMIAPRVASANTLEWMEICSEFGVAVVQVDMSDENMDPDAPCPDCDNCAICALTLTGVVQSSSITLRHVSRFSDIGTKPETVEARALRYYWPNTRGPPSANSEKQDRVFRAFPVSYSNEGGAL